MTNRRHLGVLALLALLPGCASMRDLYRTEVRTGRSAHPPDTQQLLTEDHLTALPEPVRRYLRSCGWVGQPLAMNAEIEITWTPMDERSAGAAIRHGVVEASGVFHFDEVGDFVRFESEDRYQSTGEDARKVRWSVAVLAHQDQDGLRIVDGLRATWHEDQGDFEYFHGRIQAVRFQRP
jgi:hypothetical protein